MNDQSISLTVPVRRLHPNAKLPAQKTSQAAGWDIYCLEDFTLWCGVHQVIRTGIAMAIPKGHYAHLVGRSGLAADYGIFVMGGVIDSDYRGEIRVILGMNSSTGNVHFLAGDRIAQMIFHAHYNAAWIETPELPETKRGESGLGSTGR